MPNVTRRTFYVYSANFIQETKKHKELPLFLSLNIEKIVLLRFWHVVYELHDLYSLKFNRIELVTFVVKARKPNVT